MRSKRVSHGHVFLRNRATWLSTTVSKKTRHDISDPSRHWKVAKGIVDFLRQDSRWKTKMSMLYKNKDFVLILPYLEYIINTSEFLLISFIHIKHTAFMNCLHVVPDSVLICLHFLAAYSWRSQPPLLSRAPSATILSYEHYGPITRVKRNRTYFNWFKHEQWASRATFLAIRSPNTLVAGHDVAGERARWIHATLRNLSQQW